MAGLRAVDLAKPFQVALPEVQRPYSKIDDYEKLVWVIVSAIVYNVLVELPLWGVRGALDTPDPIWWLRDVIAGTAGSPGELGIFPVVLSGATLQILAGAKRLNVSLDLRSDRVLFQSAQKLLALTLVAVFSVLLVASGTYGSLATLSPQSIVGLLAQLIIGNSLLVLIDETLTKGWGMGSGILLFTSLRVSQKFLWSALSMTQVGTARGPQYFGAIPNFVSKITSHSIGFSLVDSALRATLPNLFQLTAAVLLFGAFAALSTWRYDIPIRSTKQRATQSSFPVRLTYANAVPVLYWAALLAAFHLLSAALATAWPASLPVQLLGKWEVRETQRVAVSGLAYYLSPPPSLVDAVWDPIRTVVYVLLAVFVQGAFAQAWMESSGFAPADIAKQFKEQAIVIVGRRDGGGQKELRRIIYQATFLGGCLTGLLVALADVLGATGWGTAMAVGVLNTLNVFELLSQENIGPETLQSIQNMRA